MANGASCERPLHSHLEQSPPHHDGNRSGEEDRAVWGKSATLSDLGSEGTMTEGEYVTFDDWWFGMERTKVKTFVRI